MTKTKPMNPLNEARLPRLTPSQQDILWKLVENEGLYIEAHEDGKYYFRRKDGSYPMNRTVNPKSFDVLERNGFIELRRGTGLRHYVTKRGRQALDIAGL